MKELHLAIPAEISECGGSPTEQALASQTPDPSGSRLLLPPQPGRS